MKQKQEDPSKAKPLSARITPAADSPQPTAPDSGQPNNPLHGVKLADILERLVVDYGWEELGSRINIRCFNYDPSVKSSLAFLRKTPWAREKVEQLYLKTIKKSR